MPFYDLEIVYRKRHLTASAQDRSEALTIFGKELDLRLSLEDTDDSCAVYMLDEWEVGPHFVDPTIRVFARPNSPKPFNAKRVVAAAILEPGDSAEDILKEWDLLAKQQSGWSLDTIFSAERENYMYISTWLMNLRPKRPDALSTSRLDAVRRTLRDAMKSNPINSEGHATIYRVADAIDDSQWKSIVEESEKYVDGLEWQEDDDN